MICTQCGKEIPKQAKFCPDCGAPAPEAAKPHFCMYCGAPLTPDSRFCENCGRQQNAEEEAPKVEMPAASEAPSAAVQSPVAAPAQIPTPSAASVVGVEAVRAAGRAATGGARTAGKIAKTVAIWTAVIAFVIGLATVCLKQFVGTPEETVETFFSSVERMDFDEMLECIDSKSSSQFRAMLGIAGDLFGSITGVGLDFEDLMTLMPSIMPPMEETGLEEMEVETVLYSDYSTNKIVQICNEANERGSLDGGYLGDNALLAFLEEHNISILGLENLIAETAIVKITDASGMAEYLPMVNEGGGDWRIVMNDLMTMYE